MTASSAPETIGSKVAVAAVQELALHIPWRHNRCSLMEDVMQVHCVRDQCRQAWRASCMAEDARDNASISTSQRQQANANEALQPQQGGGSVKVQQCLKTFCRQVT